MRDSAVFNMHSAVKLFSEVPFSVLRKWYVHVNERKLYLTSFKFHHPDMTKICLSWERDSIFKSIHLQELSSDLNGRGVKISVHE